MIWSLWHWHGAPRKLLGCLWAYNQKSAGWTARERAGRAGHRSSIIFLIYLILNQNSVVNTTPAALWAWPSCQTVAMPMPASAASPSVSLAWSLPLVSEPLGVSLCHPKGSRAAWLLVWLTHGVGANYIGSRGSQRVATGTCHRRLRGEFTDGQAISIKPSSPPILLWITVLNPLNYLNSISVGILEASCSD